MPRPAGLWPAPEVEGSAVDEAPPAVLWDGLLPPTEPVGEVVELEKVGLDGLASAPPAATMEQIWVLTLRATVGTGFCQQDDAEGGGRVVVIPDVPCMSLCSQPDEMQGRAALVRSSILPHWHVLSFSLQPILGEASSTQVWAHAGICLMTSWRLWAATVAAKAE